MIRQSLLVLTWSSLVLAAAHGKLPCENSPGLEEMRQCLTNELKNAETDLQRYYNESRRMLGARPEVAAALERAQAAWQVFRDADCEAVSKHNLPGTDYPQFQDMLCKTVETRFRISALWQEYLQRSSDSKLPQPPELE